MIEGIAACGDVPIAIPFEEYREPAADAAIFYGFRGPLKQILEDYRDAGKSAVHIDLGYFGRRWRGKRYGFHKFAVNARHPTAYFQRIKHDERRAQAHGLKVRPWKKSGSVIIVAGMSAKNAGVDGFAPEQWERETIAKLKQVTDREIVYRPKPTWKEARPIEGTTYSPATEPAEKWLAIAHAVVTHHSNLAIEAVLAGVPAFVSEGVAVPVGLSDLAKIEEPFRPDDDARRQWVNDVCYTQFNLQEMQDGTAWRTLGREGLV